MTSLEEFALTRGAKPFRMVYLDIETTPQLCWTWSGTYDQNVLRIEQDSHLLCAAWKWEGSRTVEVTAQVEDPKRYAKDPTDDTVPATTLWSVLDRAHVVVAHNGDRFDLATINARFAAKGWPPPSPYRTIDTLKVAKRQFRFPSNKLDDLGRYLGIGRKVSHSGLRLWFDCMDGDERAWRTMIRYNRRDVTLLQDVYQRLAPYISNPPNLATLSADPEACPRCGAPEDRLVEKGKFCTSTIEYDQWLCQACKGWSRSRRRRSGQAQVERVNVTRR